MGVINAFIVDLIAVENGKQECLLNNFLMNTPASLPLLMTIYISRSTLTDDLCLIKQHIQTFLNDLERSSKKLIAGYDTSVALSLEKTEIILTFTIFCSECPILRKTLLSLVGKMDLPWLVMSIRIPSATQLSMF